MSQIVQITVWSIKDQNVSAAMGAPTLEHKTAVNPILRRRELHGPTSQQSDDSVPRNRK